MPKVSPLQSDFSGGELSPLAQGRVDADVYKTSLSTCLNYIPAIQGGAFRRPGSYWASEVKDSTKKTRLIPFRYSTEQAYVLEFGDLYVRAYVNGAQLTATAKNITGVTQANPAVVTIAGHGYSNGDEVYIASVGGMTQINGRNFKIAGVTANTFQLLYLDGTNVNSTSFGAYTSGGTAAKVFQATTPYTESDIFDIRYAQSADTLFLAHSSYYPYTITRGSSGGSTVFYATEYVPFANTSTGVCDSQDVDGPYLPIELDATVSVVRTAAAPTQIYTFTASTGVFSSTDLYRSIRWYASGAWHTCTIDTYTSSTVVVGRVKSTIIPDVVGAPFRLGVWYTGNWPANVLFHEDRLCYFGTPSNPDRVDMSKTGNYSVFSPTAADGTVTASHGVSVTINASEVNTHRWATSDEKGLLVGTAGAEFVVRPSSQGEALSPTNVAAKKPTSFGAAQAPVCQVGKATLYFQKSGRKLREFTYYYDVDGFQSNDLTRMATHVLQSGAKDIAFTSEPQPIVWVVRNDGVLAAMTYERDQNGVKAGWSRHILGGVSDAAGNPPIVESVAVVPSADESFDQIYMVVKRRVNGRTVRYVEYMTQYFDDTVEQEDAVFLDCALTYDNPVTISGATAANPVVITATSHGFSNGDSVVISDIEGMTELNGNIYTVANKTANTFELSGVNGTSYTAYVSGGEVRKRVSTISGLWHLEGQTVQVLADGASQPEKTVSSGAITLSTPAAVVHVGFTYSSDLEMLPINAGAADGTALGKTRRTNRVGIFMHRTLGMKIGTSFDDMTELVFRTTEDEMGHAPALFSGVMSENLAADYDFENKICIRQDGPFPGTILAIAPQMTTQDR